MEGDPYNINKINRSKQRITNLGFFNKVDLRTERVGSSNKVNVKVVVKERKTGELNFGIGYSTTEKTTANIGIKERNLFGTGKQLSFNIQKSSNRVSNSISYTKPYFLGRDIGVGIDLFNHESDRINTLVYSQKSLGATLRGSYSLVERLRHHVKYSYRDETIDDISSGASAIIASLEGSRTTSLIGHTINFENRDDRLNPREGYNFNLTQGYAGLGGDVKYIKNEGRASYYLPIYDKDLFVLKLAAKFGYIDGVGQDIRINDNFFLGGSSFRGFEHAGLGPRAEVSGSAVRGDAVGGTTYYVGTAEFISLLVSQGN